MRAFFSLLFLSSIALTVAITFAKEPANLSQAKLAVTRYYESHEYHRDISKVVANAMRYMKVRLAQPRHKKLAIVLDIDETSLSNYPTMKKLNFGGSPRQLRKAEAAANDPVIAPTLKLYQYAKAHHVAVFFITGREEEEREPTIQNLHRAGYKNWDGLYLRTDPYKNKPAAIYKTSMRKALNDRGYDIILNMGDQKSDLIGGFADKAFKLPNPFYLIP